MKKLIFLGILIFCVCLATKAENPNELVFMVQLEPAVIKDDLRIYIDWKTIHDRIGNIDSKNITITDVNNDKIIVSQLVDTDNDGTPEGVFFKIPFDRNLPFDGVEPIHTFCIREINLSQAKDPAWNITVIPQYDSVQITYLTRAETYLASRPGHKVWSEIFAKSILVTYPDPASLEIFSRGRWSYTNGFFLNALYEIYKKSRNPEYLDYIKQWVNLFVDGKGNIDTTKYRKDHYELDGILPGRLLLYLFEEEGDKRYAYAATQLVNQMNSHPRTSEGGFWHKKVYTQQMWLDGIYMADVFLAQYASVFKESEYFDEAAKQMELIYKHTLDSKTGLLYHGWDESKNKIWANQQTGASPEFWGRALGWYIMALVDGLDYFPVDHPKRSDILRMFKDLSASLSKYQDQSSGLWYQVIDKADKPGNWPESSCTAMIAYAFAKGVQKGYLEQQYLQKAKKAFDGLVAREIYFDNEGKAYLTGTVKVGTLNFRFSKGDFDYYINVDRRINDFKGVAAVMYLAHTLESLK